MTASVLNVHSYTYLDLKNGLRNYITLIILSFLVSAKISELEGEIQCNDAMKNKLEHDKQMLDSKLTVMQEFYAKREVEIQR